MLLLASYDIVFQEVPGEVTLALNLSCCPNRCSGCHSPHLREEIGEPLEDLLDGLLARYGDSATCVAFMGGDGDVAEVVRMAFRVRASGLKTAWYSGRERLPEPIEAFDFVKLGAYIPEFGGLDSPTTNQRFYAIVGDKAVDRTSLFQRPKPLAM